jgi:hypothetical protein
VQLRRVLADDARPDAGLSDSAGTDAHLCYAAYPPAFTVAPTSRITAGDARCARPTGLSLLVALRGMLLVVMAGFGFAGCGQVGLELMDDRAEAT